VGSYVIGIRGYTIGMSFRWPTIVIILFAGVVLSVAVSWRFAMFSRALVKQEALNSIDAKLLWTKYVNAPIRGKGLEANRFEGSGRTEIALVIESTESIPVYFFDSCVLIRTGWPLRCLARERLSSVDSNNVYNLHEVAALIIPRKLGPVYWGERRLPIRVLWGGMIFNTLFYAFLSGLFIVALRKLRQRIRLDRKYCPQCNYNLCKSITATGAVCPECSHKVSEKLFERPKLILRWWMVPMLLPIIALFLAWTVGIVNWYRLSLYLSWEYPSAGHKVLFSLLVGLSLLFFIAIDVYPDRSSKQRIALAGAVALIFSVLTYLPIYILVIIYETWPN